MKIIIAYASAGAGHRKAAEALHQCFNQKFPEADIKLVDILDKTNPFFKDLYVYGYSFLINHAKWLWGLFFWLTSARRLSAFYDTISLFVNRLNAADFHSFLIKEQPDVIISTHFMPPQVASYLLDRKKIKSKLFTVITDFGVHPFWITKNVDGYFVASDITASQLIAKGISRDNIFGSGIPTDRRFSIKHEKRKLIEKLSLKDELFTVLITTGSFGIGKIETITESLLPHAQVIIVCANNKVLYQKLIRKNYPNVKVYGFVDNIYELMAVADIVIAKPGGLTTSEILNMEIVPVFISPIPGQEINNIKVMQLYGLGASKANAKEIKNIILDYKLHPEKMDRAREIIKKIKKPESCQVIYDAVRKNCARPAR